jgi:hypothetical protein
MKTTNPNERSLVIERVLTQNKGRQFKYGDWDCLLFCAECVKGYTDVDYAEQYRGKYDSARSAEKVILKENVDSPVAFVAKVLNTEALPSLRAEVGSVLARQSSDGIYAFGICLGARGVFLTKKGLYAFYSLTDCSHSFRIS